MSDLIGDFWIFSKDGLPLISFYKDVKMDNVFMGGFLSAIESFSKQLSGKALKSFTFGDAKLAFSPCFEGNLILVCKCNLTYKEKKINKFFNEIIKILEEMYTIEDIKKWDGNISFFDGLKDKLELIFNKP